MPDDLRRLDVHDNDSIVASSPLRFRDDAGVSVQRGLD
jgi:hypothetical protein